jgi:hypothetical protein
MDIAKEVVRDLRRLKLLLLISRTGNIPTCEAYNERYKQIANTITK